MAKDATDHVAKKHLSFRDVAQTEERVTEQKTAGSSEFFDQATSYVAHLFSIIFFMEFIIKVIALNYKYFWDAWNRFDFLLVLISVVDVFLLFLTSEGVPFNPGVLRVFRVFRVLRILRLIRKAKKARVLIETLWYSLPSLGNIFAFLLLLFFMYAVLGVQLFASIHHGEFIKRDANFTNFLQAQHEGLTH